MPARSAPPGSRSTSKAKSCPARPSSQSRRHPNETAEAVLFGTGPAFGYSARSYFNAISFGQIDYAGGADDIYGWYEIKPWEGFCNYGTWTKEAEEAAAKDGFDRNDYDQVVYYLEPSIVAAPCAYGIGSAGYTFMKSINHYVTVHELAHGLSASPGEGSPHAGALRCHEGPTPVAYSASCEEIERGDPFDPMGDNFTPPLFMSGWRLLNFGAIPAADAPTITTSGTYSIAPLEHGGGGTRLLRIPDGAGRFFDLDFRQSTGFFDQGLSPTAPITNGVSIRLDPPGFAANQQSLLLDTVPETETFNDAPLTTGRQFRDFRTGVTIETLATGPSGAAVRVTGLPGPAGPATVVAKPKRCEVAGLKGKKAKAARKAIAGGGCAVGKVKRRHSRKVPRGRVISQGAKAGNDLPAGTKVDIVVSSGPVPKG